MNSRPTAHRTTLLLGTAFLTGLTIGPAAGLIARHIGLVSGGNAAFAQDSDGPIPPVLALFGDVFERAPGLC